MIAMLFPDLTTLAQHLRQELENKKFILLYAYNGIGKTRLSTDFKEIGKKRVQDRLMSPSGDILTTQSGDELLTEEKVIPDTLYFNAFTEDLFTWDNDLDNDRERVLKINAKSRFFAGLGELEMDTRIRPLLNRYADFDFKIDTEEWEVSFSREVIKGEGENLKIKTEDKIKISRGEENVFIWCFFIAIVQLALDDDGSGPYKWVKYIYIDDPISSLDEHNAIAVACHLAQLLKNEKSKLKTVISTHHALFFNVLCNELKNARKYFLSVNRESRKYFLRETGDTPFFHHVALLAELHQAAKSGKLYTYHFNMLRTILEKTAGFHGFNRFSACIKKQDNDADAVLHARLINILSHGNYSLYEPREMMEENKASFRQILEDFMTIYRFNPELFPKEVEDP